VARKQTKNLTDFIYPKNSRKRASEGGYDGSLGPPEGLGRSFDGQIARHAQPARKLIPPMGVMAPSQRALLKARTYSDPEKTTIPIRKLNQDHFLRGVCVAKTKSITV